MGSTRIYFSERPELSKPVLIEGLPGVGNVGKVAADFMCQSLGGRRFATVFSENFPPQASLDGECVCSLARNELYCARGVGDAGRDVVFLLGDCQGTTPAGQFEVCDDLMDEVVLRLDVSFVYTLGGYGTGAIVEEPRVLGAVTGAELKPELERHGVSFSPGEPPGGIVGGSGLLLGLAQMHGIDGACLMGETSGYFVDYRCAIAIVRVLESILGVETDKSELEGRSQQIEEITSKVKEYQASQGKEDLGYIG